MRCSEIMEKALHTTQDADPELAISTTVDQFDVLVTAEEAYPAFERAFLTAKSEIIASFRVIDLATRLRSPEARKIGTTWMDLLVHTLDRGVAVRLVTSDFDPVAAPELHQRAWRTLRQIAAVRELTHDHARLDFTLALHDARTGIVPRLILYPLVRHKMNQLAQTWRKMSEPERERFRIETPRLQKICYEDGNGRLCFPLRPVDLYPATHHQKMAVFDRETLYIGGLDLNERRYDTKRHRRAAERTWHDIQALATGPVAQAAQAHLESFLDSVAGRLAPPAAAPGFLRTLSRGHRGMPLRLAPRTLLREIETRHIEAVGRARHLIYLETQFLRHIPLARALERRVRACPDLRLIVVLPAAPEDAAFDSNQGLDVRYGEYLQVRCLTRLKRVFGSNRLLVASPVQPRKTESDGRDALKDAPLIYVHSKVSIFDDFGAILSSANLNGRSMRWDTEAGLYLDQPHHVEDLRRRVMGHWLPPQSGAAYLDPQSAFDHWRRLVETNSALPPGKRQGFLVRYDSDVARDMAAPIPGMPDEIV